MSEFPLGSFEFADRIMDAKVEEARREAQARRLRQQALAAGPRRHGFFGAALARLGQHLSTWGAGLEARYRVEGSNPTESHTG